MNKKLFIYLLFAALCTFINLGSQKLMENYLENIKSFEYIIFSQTLAFWIQLLTGTILGFVVKFSLDKAYVFKNKHQNMKHTFIQFIKSSAFAVITTVIFWSSEILFHTYFDFNDSDKVGGFIGLAIGYVIKFFYDRKFVFPSEEAN